MKNTIKILGIIAIVAVIVFTMSSCGGGNIPNGKYVKGTSETYWEFSGKNVTYHAHANYIVKGTFLIDNDRLFNFIQEDGDIDKYLFAIEDKSLLLESTTYIKE